MPHSRAQSSISDGRQTCCFNLRRTACLCATSQRFSSALGGVIDDCVFNRSLVSATPIAGPSPAERNKMERYRRYRSASVDLGVACPRTASQTAPSRPRRSQMPNADDAARLLIPVSELITRLYKTYGYQFTSSYRQPAAHPVQTPTRTSKLGAGDLGSDDEAATGSVMSHRPTMQAATMQTLRAADDGHSRSLKRVNSPSSRRNLVSSQRNGVYSSAHSDVRRTDYT